MNGEIYHIPYISVVIKTMWASVTAQHWLMSIPRCNDAGIPVKVDPTKN